ncbi:MAG: CopG family antitoxin [Ktedonobacterales bacterium]
MKRSNKMESEKSGLHYPTEARGGIPSFQSLEDEASFWDSHDTSDFESAFAPVTVKFARNLSESLKVRFDAETLAILRARAQEKGIGPTTLVRMWILEHIERDQRHSA